jgi:catechol 2,3-dioxygenase-like lactoylglutathione lyase family enzyme
MKLHHVAYAVPSIEQAIRVWQGLGARIESPVIDIQAHQAKVCFLRLADAPIELVERANSSGRIDHLCFLCGDFSARVAQAREHNGVVIKRPAPSEAFGGKLMCFISYSHLGLIEWIDDPAGAENTDAC